MRAGLWSLLDSMFVGTPKSGAYMQLEPIYRVVAFGASRSEPVGQVSVVPLAREPAVFGLADSAVHLAWRQQGLIRAMLERAVRRCLDDPWDAILGTAVHLGIRGVLARLGFRPVTYFECCYADATASRFDRLWQLKARGPLPRPLWLPGTF